MKECTIVSFRITVDNAKKAIVNNEVVIPLTVTSITHTVIKSSGKRLMIMGVHKILLVDRT